MYFVGRISKAAMGGPKGEALLSRVQRSSEGCSIAQKGAAYPEGAA